MIQKLVLALALVALFALPARAELVVANDPLINLIPTVENAWFWDFSQSELINATGTKLLAYKGFEASAFWGTGVGDNERTENLVLGSVGYNLGTLEKFGISYPLLNIIDIKPSIFCGLNVDRKAFSYGVGATIVKVKF